MGSIELYREMIGAHADVDSALILRWLDLAARRHTAEAWGNVYAEGMILWAAHNVELDPASGIGNAEGGVPLGAITSQKDGDLSRTYAAPDTGATGSSSAGAFGTTTYGLQYVDLRDSRAAGAPGIVFGWSW